MSQSREDVIAAVARAFRSHERDAVLSELDRYGVEPYERERERVQIAVVELSDGDRARLSMYVAMAKVDYRDVLASQELGSPSHHGSHEAGMALRTAAEEIIKRWGETSIKVGVHGELGSACDGVAAALLRKSNPTYVYLTDAMRAVAAVQSGEVDVALLAAESPLGVPIGETAAALSHYPEIVEVAEYNSEVRHCVMARAEANAIRAIASHEIPLKKHREFLAWRYPGYREISVADTGLAAKELAEGTLPADVAVIAMPRAAEVFGLRVLERELPANDRYLTRFILVKRRTPGVTPIT